MVCEHCLLTLSATINEILKRLSYHHSHLNTESFFGGDNVSISSSNTTTPTPTPQPPTSAQPSSLISRKRLLRRKNPNGLVMTKGCQQTPNEVTEEEYWFKHFKERVKKTFSPSLLRASTCLDATKTEEEVTCRVQGSSGADGY